jgi:hypothetical protein
MKEDWKELYQYVKKEIMCYPDELKLSKYFILRLKGLSQGKFISNRKVENMGEYNFKDILITFKLCKLKIKDCLNTMTFKDESHKVNTIMMHIEKEINDVVLRLKNKEKTTEKVKDIEIKEILEYKGGDNKKTHKKLDNLW